ncbi:MAG: ATP-binding cassette domain-containing protein [Tissierellia bacterium]|nr:ATP-binding cassette domain-containing protein [Tissierellia bacterium]
MLKLYDISKTYTTGDFTQKALDGININFRENEFVSILGPSGSGKTTMLNIIGGLDQYDDGDLVINNISTKKYKSRDWDNYRNKSIGFVFQSYNLIAHQSVLSNVELALTIAGVSKRERKERAKEALDKVGLIDHIHKKPNQLSGGQMQRVAIARALVNNPDILLADEPTGALDTQTSVQVMALLKEIAKDKLVIMVTHNPELAEKYSTRIVNLLDGKIISDSSPYQPYEASIQETKSKKERVSMSFLTALSLSFNNLKTKKGRTILTSFAGSIGIIGIALILSLSTGMQGYIEKTEEDTLSSYPITIESQGIDLLGIQEERMETAQNMQTENEDPLDKVYQGGFVGDNLKMRTIRINDNDLSKFKDFLESEKSKSIVDATTAIAYDYGVRLNVYDPDTSGDIKQINPSPLLNQEGPMGNALPGMSLSPEVFTEMIDNSELLHSQYNLLSGNWPQKYDEVLLVVNEDNQISDMTLYTLGLKDSDEITEIQEKIDNEEEIVEENYEKKVFSYDELIGLEYKVVPQSSLFEKVDDLWVEKSKDTEFIKSAIEDAFPIKITGIVKPNEDAVSSTINGTIGYTKELSDKLIEMVNDSQIVKDQKNTPNKDIFTGNEFIDVENMNDDEFIEILSDQEKLQLNSAPDPQKPQLLERFRQTYSSSYDKNIARIGAVDYDNPTAINLYLKDFESREQVVESINQYNDEQRKLGDDASIIQYTDFVGLMTSSITSIIDMITYLLIGFVSISLVVSSIMIGIITYISVLERTKEIGVLRSIGASKKDIARVFNAETAIVGFSAGLIGILVTLLLLIPINSIISTLSGVEGLAYLPPQAGVILVAISMFLTIIAGLIPAKMASKKDPVIALRSE